MARQWRRDLNGAKPGDVLPMPLRPEALRIGAGGDGRNTLAGAVEDVAFLGAVARVRLAQTAAIVDAFNSGAGELPTRGAPIVANYTGDDLIPLQPAWAARRAAAVAGGESSTVGSAGSDGRKRPTAVIGIVGRNVRLWPRADWRPWAIEMSKRTPAPA